VHEAQDSAVVPITACSEDASTWLANGDGDVCVFKSHTLGGKEIKIRGQAGHFTAETAKGVAMEIVSGEEQDIEVLFFRASGSNEWSYGQSPSSAQS